jgi:phage FluMu protein Com
MTAKKGTTLQDFVRQRGVIQELNPELARIAIQGYEDEITPAAKADESFYRQFRCPRCKSEMSKEFLGGARGVGVTWVDGSLTPRALLRCNSCKLLLNPHTAMIVEMGIRDSLQKCSE